MCSVWLGLKLVYSFWFVLVLKPLSVYETEQMTPWLKCDFSIKLTKVCVNNSNHFTLNKCQIDQSCVSYYRKVRSPCLTEGQSNDLTKRCDKQTDDKKTTPSTACIPLKVETKTRMKSVTIRYMCFHFSQNNEILTTKQVLSVTGLYHTSCMIKFFAILGAFIRLWKFQLDSWRFSFQHCGQLFVLI